MFTMFATKSLGAHLLRGATGGLLFAGSFAAGTSHVLLAAALGVGGLVALRGCPLCWMMSLIKAFREQGETRCK